VLRSNKTGRCLIFRQAVLFNAEHLDSTSIVAPGMRFSARQGRHGTILSPRLVRAHYPLKYSVFSSNTFPMILSAVACGLAFRAATFRGVAPWNLQVVGAGGYLGAENNWGTLPHSR